MCSQEPMSKYSEVHQAGDEGAAASGRREGGEEGARPTGPAAPGGTQTPQVSCPVPPSGPRPPPATQGAGSPPRRGVCAPGSPAAPSGAVSEPRETRRTLTEVNALR